MVTMSCSGNLVWDVNKRLIGYNEPNTIRTNYLGKNKTSLSDANVNVGEILRKHKGLLFLTLSVAGNSTADCVCGAESDELILNTTCAPSH